MAKVLIVDDEIEVLNVYKVILSQRPEHSVELINDGNEAYHKATKITYDLIITDLIMPELTGLELIKKLKLLPAYKTVPMIVVTIDQSKDQVQEGIKAGISGWFVKPIKSEALLSKIDEVFHKKN